MLPMAKESFHTALPYPVQQQSFAGASHYYPSYIFLLVLKGELRMNGLFLHQITNYIEQTNMQIKILIAGKFFAGDHR